MTGHFLQAQITARSHARLTENKIAYTNGAFDISGISGSKIKRAEIEITDIFGNRAKRTLLFKPAGYNSALPVFRCK